MQKQYLVFLYSCTYILFGIYNNSVTITYSESDKPAKLAVYIKTLLLVGQMDIFGDYFNMASLCQILLSD